MSIEPGSFRLADGRLMGFAEYGDRDGTPVLFCHGAPGSRWQVHPRMADSAAHIGVRLIVPERPGYGLSDPYPDMTHLDWASDAGELMDSLDIGRYAMLGYSMGGIYAMACGYHQPDRVSSIAVVGGMAPNPFEPEVAAAMAPAVVQTLLAARDNPDTLAQLIDSLADNPAQLLEMMAESLPPADRIAMADPAIEASFLKSCEAALRNNGVGLFRDFLLASRDWQFSPNDVSTEVLLWHGTADVNVPPAMATYLSSHLPNCHLTLLPGEGHCCLFRHWDEILQALHARRLQATLPASAESVII